MSKRADYKTRFQDQGKGMSSQKTNPITVRLPLDVIEALGAVAGGRSPYINAVVKAALIEDGHLPKE